MRLNKSRLHRNKWSPNPEHQGSPEQMEEVDKRRREGEEEGTGWVGWRGGGLKGWGRGEQATKEVRKAGSRKGGVRRNRGKREVRREKGGREASSWRGGRGKSCWRGCSRPVE